MLGGGPRGIICSCACWAGDPVPLSTEPTGDLTAPRHRSPWQGSVKDMASASSLPCQDGQRHRSIFQPAGGLCSCELGDSHRANHKGTPSWIDWHIFTHGCICFSYTWGWNHCFLFLSPSSVFPLTVLALYWAHPHMFLGPHLDRVFSSLSLSWKIVVHFAMVSSLSHHSN